MNTYRYYRFTGADVLAASEEYQNACVQLAYAAEAFAKEFGGKPVYLRRVEGRSLGGLRFSPPKSTELWTKPDTQLGMIQRPRSSTKSSGLRRELAALKERWNALFPKIRPSTDALYKAMGTDWGSLLFAGIGFVLTASAVYVTTSLDLSSKGQEITGSEYIAASEQVQP